MKETLNDLDGKTWLKYSISIWSIEKTHQEMKLEHPAVFPLELCKRLIEIFTKKGDTVLDPFVGSGTTMVAARDLERHGIGFDVNPKFIEIAKKRVSQQKIIPLEIDDVRLYCEDARNILNFVKPNSVDLIITSPPYWDVLWQKRTADGRDSRPYSSLENDIGNISDFDEFMNVLTEIFEKCYSVLKEGKNIVVIVKDIRKGSIFIPYHIKVIDIMEKIGFKLDDIIIWDRRQAYNNLVALGYPYVFVVNTVHEYILLFEKS